MSVIFYNGSMLPANGPVLEAGNRLFQYSDGLFETMRISNSAIVLGHYHFERLLNGMQSLLMETPSWFTPDYLKDAILALCKENDQLSSARVRLTVFRKASAPGEAADQPCVLIESWPLDNQYVFRDQPFSINIYDGARKSMDATAACKTTAYLPYALAAVFARQQGLNDCLVLNAAGNICDSSIANVFVIKNETVHTPLLTEGCIAGVMRRHILNSTGQTNFTLKETPIDTNMLLTADEVFLTNVIRGIQPVTRFREANYTTKSSAKIFDDLIRPLTVC